MECANQVRKFQQAKTLNKFTFIDILFRLALKMGGLRLPTMSRDNMQHLGQHWKNFLAAKFDLKEIVEYLFVSLFSLEQMALTNAERHLRFSEDDYSYEKRIFNVTATDRRTSCVSWRKSMFALSSKSLPTRCNSVASSRNHNFGNWNISYSQAKKLQQKIE